MTRFRLKADAVFYAENIDVAFLVLARHFLSLAEEGLDEPEVIVSGGIVIEPVKEEG